MEGQAKTKWPAQAEEMILAHLKLLSTEEVDLAAAHRRILRQDLVADRPFPPFDRVTMDGLAFRAGEERDGILLLHGLHPAGAPLPEALPPHHAWQIMTGAEMPPDCDTVIPYEEVEIIDSRARLFAPYQKGQCLHLAASDAQKGDLLLASPLRLSPGHLGLLASLGVVRPSVTRLPKIQIFTTGDELVPPRETPLSHQIRRSNDTVLRAALDQWGPTQTQVEHLPDDLEIMIAKFSAALEIQDLLIITGGISKGRRDYVRPALEAILGPPIFHGVAQRPGKPLAFWERVFALPGNPNSTLVTFHRYLVPALQKLVGEPTLPRPTFPLTKAIPQQPALTQFLPATLQIDGKLTAHLPQNSGDFLTPLQATHLIEIPPGTAAATEARVISSSLG